MSNKIYLYKKYCTANRKKCHRSTEEKRENRFSMLFTKEFAFVLVPKVCVTKELEVSSR